MNLFDLEVVRFVLAIGLPLAVMVLACWVCDEFSLWRHLRRRQR